MNQLMINKLKKSLIKLENDKNLSEEEKEKYINNCKKAIKEHEEDKKYWKKRNKKRRKPYINIKTGEEK